MSAEAREVLAALVMLRGLPAPLTPALAAALPEIAGPEAAASRLAAHLTSRPASPAARFVERFERRSPDAPPPGAAAALRRELRILRQARQTQAEAMGEQALTLAVALAERLVREARPVGDLADEVRRALGDGPVRALACADQVADLQAALGDEALVSADPALLPGDLVLILPAGRRDLRVRTRLAALLAGAQGAS